MTFNGKNGSFSWWLNAKFIKTQKWKICLSLCLFAFFWTLIFPKIGHLYFKNSLLIIYIIIRSQKVLNSFMFLKLSYTLICMVFKMTIFLLYTSNMRTKLHHLNYIAILNSSYCMSRLRENNERVKQYILRHFLYCTTIKAACYASFILVKSCTLHESYCCSFSL